ncbi:hypothetical protein [Taibaiella koreensis]|uniref:hypothetical protein n=1 Tax=Taibaiella koreensis TaxID=1268548 RepID=UPI000E5A022A|nr:hypothetical protein [Taibaiella koreensis]
MSFQKSILFPCLLASAAAVYGQEKLGEGMLTYAVTISGKVPTPANEPALTEAKSGILSIYVKDNYVRQDIKLEDGYTYSRISNYITDKDIILQTINTTHYAIEIGMKEERKKNIAFLNATLEPGRSRKKIGDFEAQEAKLQYRDGSTFQLYYIDRYTLLHPEVFERSPELNGIPALFDIPGSNGFSTHFELKTISPEPVSSSVFQVPEGYRIISRKEYEKLIR